MSPSARTTLLLGGILLVGFAVRATDLNGPSLFVDEFSEISLARQGTTDIIYANDSAPPLFPLTLKAWLAVWQTDAAARWMSLACGLLSIACVWGIGRELVDDATGLAAAAITAILPMHVYYSQFVRCYSLLFLFVALDLWLLLIALRTNQWKHWLAFAAIALLGAYTHYYYVIFLATSAVLVLIFVFTSTQQAAASPPSMTRLKPAIASYLLIALLMLPLFRLLPGDLAFQKSLRDPRPLNLATFGYTYFSLVSGYTLGPSPSELQTMTGAQAVRGAAPWIAIVGSVLLVLGYTGWRRVTQFPALLNLLTLAVLPVLILGTLSLLGGLNYNVRFVTWIMIAAAIWLGAGIAASWRNPLVTLATLALVVLSTVAFTNRHWVGRYEHEDLRAAAAYLHTHATPTDTVYILSDYLGGLMRYYLGDNWRVVELPKPGDVNQIVHDRKEADEAAAIVARHPAPSAHAWVVYSRPFHGDPHALLLESLTARGTLTLADSFPGVAIYGPPSHNVAAK